MSTHIVSDVDNIAREVVMIQDGQVSDMQTSKHFIARVNGKVWTVTMNADNLLEFQKHAVISNVVPMDNEMEVRVISDIKPYENAVCTEPSLEDVYLYMYNYKGASCIIQI